MTTYPGSTPASTLFSSTMLIAGLAMSATSVQAEDRFITLASTTSTQNSGLFDAIIPSFTEDSGIDVRVVAVGTGQAFEIARRGDADSLLVQIRKKT